MQLNLMKTPQGYLVPAGEEDQVELAKIKTGTVISAEFKQKRNYKYHQKFFALLNYGYDHFEPQPISDKFNPVKNFDCFRKDVVILAGYYESYVRLNGETRIEAKSIKFGRMKPEEFEKLYSKVVDVLIERVLRNYTKEDLNNVIDNLIGFT